MPELFELPVTFNGDDLLLPAEFLPMGYTHKIKVTINQADLLFEPDEERNYRAVIPDTDRENFSKPNVDLVRAVCEALDGLFGSGS